MAAKPFSKEELNFFKFSKLVIHEFPNVIRRIFIIMWDSRVAIRPGYITWDDSTQVRNMLLTSEGGKTDIPTTKSIDEWDCTTLFKATIYAKTFKLKKVKPPPGSFHSSVQSSTGKQDETYALVIDQLRLLRNTLCHLPKSELIKTDFDNYVLLVKDALSAVNIDTAFVDAIGQMNEDDFPTDKVKELEECRMKELQATSMFHEYLEQKVSSIEEKVDRLMSGINLEEKANEPSVGAISKTPNEIMVVPVSEPVAAAHEGPEIIVYPSQGVPQAVPKVIVIPATQLQVAQRLPDGNGTRPQTTSPLPVRVSSTIPIVTFNSTVHPSSSFVSPTVSLPTSLSIKDPSSNIVTNDVCRPFTPKELSRIARRISSVWRNVARLTNLFESYDIDNIFLNISFHDPTEKATQMLNSFKSRLGKREDLAKAIKESGEADVAAKVHSGYYIDNCD